MRRIYEFAIGIIIILSAIIFMPPVEAKAQVKKNVLFISSYSPKFISFNDQYDGIIAGLENDAEVQVEYMDAKTFSSEENEINFYNLLKYKLNNYKDIDAILLGDDAALEFGIKYRDELFKNIPMVFFGVSSKKNLEKTKNIPGVSGIMEIESIEKNLELITKLPSKYKKITLIADNEEDTRRLIDEFYSYKTKYSQYEFSHITTKNMSSGEFKKYLKNVGDDTVLLATYLNTFKNGNYSIQDAIALVNDNVNPDTPIFTVVNYGVGQGYLGGFTINHYEQAKRAAEMVDRILKGEDPKKLYIEDDSTNKYIFDHEKLKKFKLHSYDIPKDSIIVNEPILKRKENRDILAGVVLAFMGMISIILALIIYTVSDARNSRKLLKAKELAEEANRAKDNFISNISHELRTPVAVIMSSNQLLKLKSSNKRDNILGELDKNISIVNQNCYRLLRLINNIIDVARVDQNIY